MPPEIANIDFAASSITNNTATATTLTSPSIAWRKFHPYHPAQHLPLTPPDTPPNFPSGSIETASLCFHVHAISKRARATTLHLLHGPVRTPVFMPVGTTGTSKGRTTHELLIDSALNHDIILGNTYHLARRRRIMTGPTIGKEEEEEEEQEGAKEEGQKKKCIERFIGGSDLIEEMGGLHTFMNWPRNILTDSGGFQMVSLLKLAEITENGVTFDDPYSSSTTTTTSTPSTATRGGNNTYDECKNEKRERLLLTPEDSIRHQNKIGADIIMALDDVVSSVHCNTNRFREATYRTLRWLDRCIGAHQYPQKQNLFAIVQGGLDTTSGGLREQCLAGFRHRDTFIPGYAIGGLAGGESKDDFWKVVD
ncbi:MAG: tRNA-ribosyltransferase family protein, partial [Gaiellaceae bacterium]